MNIPDWYSIPDRHTNLDSFYVKGKIGGYKNIICLGGREKIVAPIRNTFFEFFVYLKNNQLNELIIYAVDDYGRCSDTVKYDIIHDNIPPKFLSTSLPENTISVSANLPIKLDFDSPLQQSEVHLHYYNQVSVPSILVDSAKTVEVATSLRVGLDYSMRIVVSDSANNQIDSTISFQTYYKKFSTEGHLDHPIFSDDGTYIFFQTYDPHALIQYDVNSWQLIKEIPISAPGYAAFNPHNKHIYITNFNESKIIVIDTITGQQIKEIILLDTGNQTYTPNDPVSIAFTTNGTAVVTAMPIGSSGPYSVQIIDSQNNDSVYVHPQFTPEVFYDYAACSFNNFKNVFLADYNTHLYVYNYITNSFTATQNPQSTCLTFKGHQTADRFMIYGNVGAFLLNSAGNILSDVSFRSRYFDFTYKVNEENLLYYIDTFESEIGILDFNLKTKTHKTQFGRDCQYLDVTRDGNYIISLLNSEIMIIEPKSFR